MDKLDDVFNNVISDLHTVNWSETDGSDVKKILRDAFIIHLNHKPEIIKMFEETSALNKFQKTMVNAILLKM